MNVRFEKLTNPTPEVVEHLNRWENDPILIPFIRPNQTKEDIERKITITPEDLEKRLEYAPTYLIYLQDQLIGVIDYQINPKVLYKEKPGTAWIGIIIGEEIGRGKGIGYLAMQFLEEQIKLQGLKRIELGVFEFNKNAIKLYKKLGYKEFARLNDFTYWQGKMWQDIRMEKYIAPSIAIRS
jgi:RimJ/RimL family protein N-acetyltransferase